MFVGVAGCGKSTWAAKLAGYENSQDKNHSVFQEMNKRILSDLKAGYSCIYDATNMNRKRRMNFLKNIPAGVHKSCVMFLTPPIPTIICLLENTWKNTTYMFLLDAYLGNSIWKYGSFQRMERSARRKLL